MKIIEPTPLVADAAKVIAPFWQHVVVIGAAALQIVLADDQGEREETLTPAGLHAGAQATHDDLAMVTPTRDVDLAVDTELAAEIVAQLEEAGLAPSGEPGETGFTWVRDDLKIQLVRSFHPFPDRVAKRLPANPVMSLLNEEAHRIIVAFEDKPEVPRLQSANAAALIALKQAAFGRTRHDGAPVERDFHDAYLVVAARPDDLERTYRAADYHVRSRVDTALGLLAEGGDATRAAAHQHVLVTGAGDLSEHALSIRRAATFFKRRLAAA